MVREDEGNRAAAFHDRRTKRPSGKETGQSVTYYILPEGPNAKACPKPKAKGVSTSLAVGTSRQQSKAKKASGRG
jgi:hypothetical protein